MVKSMSTAVVTACESCRGRKVRCDKVHPRCGPCQKHGLECIFVMERVKRGPRKGELGRLKAQVATLKQQLVDQQARESKSPSIYTIAPGEVAQSQASTNGHAQQAESQADQEAQQANLPKDLVPEVYSSSRGSQLWDVRTDPEFMAWLDLTLPATELGLPMEQSSRNSSIWDPGQLGPRLDNLVKADLEATYFDRAHSFMPLLHRTKFHSWADLDTLPPGQECLRSAVWTVAAAFCPRFHDLYESLYTHTRHLLQALDCGDHGHLWAPVATPQLETIQAWLLIGHCDFIRHDRHVAMLTAARVSRLVQAACLNLQQHTGTSMSEETGLLTPNCAANIQDVTLDEERSRAFWVAFCFDRTVNSLEYCHFTLQDDAAYLPLPWPEAAYQASEPAMMSTLADVLEIHRVDMNACFAEGIVAIALYGRCLTHRRLAATVRAHERKLMPSSSAAAATPGNSECHRRHAWLVQALDQRFRSASRSSIRSFAPMLVLAHLLNLGCVVHLLETLVEHVDFLEQHVDQVYNAYNAVVNIAQFTTTLPQAACFKMHPLVPVVLSQAFDFLQKYRYILERDRDPASINQTLQCLVLQLEKFEDVHIVAREFLEKCRSKAW